jgi:hypothetical protein
MLAEDHALSVRACLDVLSAELRQVTLPPECRDRFLGLLSIARDGARGSLPHDASGEARIHAPARMHTRVRSENNVIRFRVVDRSGAAR